MTEVTSDYKTLHQAWRAERLAKLTALDGWLNLTDRLWLQPGTSRFGRAADNDLVISIGPDYVGSLVEAENGDVVFHPADGGDSIALPRDNRNSPRFTVGSLHCEITVTNGRNALRIRDAASPKLTAFDGIECFPADESWRIQADWVLLDSPLPLTVNSSQNIPSEVVVQRKAVFSYGGETYELLATHGTPERPQFVFRDLTSGTQTYPSARFLFGEEVTETSIVLDFNKSYNPPCSFTPHANCPVAPEQNVLPIAITAGELKP